MLIDTHCHLTYDALRPQIGAVLQRAADAGVGACITVATTPADARAALELMGAHRQVWLCAGIHPHEAGKCTPEDLDALTQLHRAAPAGADDPLRRLIAVGETGLDFHYNFATPERQEEVFRFQLRLAEEVGRPVVIHARNAETRVCEILAEHPRLAGRVVFHCYSADTKVAGRILDLGDLVSFTGVVTFKNAATVRESAKFVPLERMMVETDCPYLTPEPVRKIYPNEPAFTAHTARFLAELRGISFEEFAAATTRTATRFFGVAAEPQGPTGTEPSAKAGR